MVRRNLKLSACLLGLSLIQVGCLESDQDFAALAAQLESEEVVCPDENRDQAGPLCQILQLYSVFVEDSFERDQVVSEEQGFGWRKIINDYGKIIGDKAGQNVDVSIFDQNTLGLAGDLDRSVYFYGREGYSTHNVYLVSQSFDLSAAHAVDISFKYLPIDLEESEYIHLEVCNGSRDECGVGESLSVQGLNSDKWSTLFTIENAGDGLNGRNHVAQDWQDARVAFLITQEHVKKTFTFRFNVRVDEGFKSDNINLAMEDGVGIDQVQAKAYAYKYKSLPDLDGQNPADELGGGETPSDPDVITPDPIGPDDLEDFPEVTDTEFLEEENNDVLEDIPLL